MRKALLLAIKAAVSGLLLYLALRAVNIQAVMDRFSQLDPRWIGLGLLVLVAQLAVVAIRWQQIVIRCGAALRSGAHFASA